MTIYTANESYEDVKDIEFSMDEKTVDVTFYNDSDAIILKLIDIWSIRD
jgi:hypothetical protein